jgi:hypothetical protein
MSQIIQKATYKTATMADAIGKGLIAGMLGTAAITLSQLIEMKLDGRQPSEAPAEAADKVIGAVHRDQDKKEGFSTAVNWGYGTAWGAVRGLISEAGLSGWVASAVHFGAIYSAAQIMLPSMSLAKPVYKQQPKSILLDVLHHAVYAAVTGFVYDALEYSEEKEAIDNLVGIEIDEVTMEYV